MAMQLGARSRNCLKTAWLPPRRRTNGGLLRSGGRDMVWGGVGGQERTIWLYEYYVHFLSLSLSLDYNRGRDCSTSATPIIINLLINQRKKYQNMKH